MRDLLRHQTARSIIFRAFANTKRAAVAITAIGGLLIGQAAASPSPHAERTSGLIEVQYRSYLEGRDFQSYRQDRGFSQRRFDQPGPRGETPSADPDRPSRLQRRSLGSSDSRCGQWSRRCDQRWGSGNPDYYGCLRYHGCR